MMFNQKFSSLMSSLKNKSRTSGLSATRLYILAGIAVLLIVAAFILMSADDKPSDNRTETFELNTNNLQSNPAQLQNETPIDFPDAAQNANQQPQPIAPQVAPPPPVPASPDENGAAEGATVLQQDTNPQVNNQPPKTQTPMTEEKSEAESYILYCGGWSNKNTAESSKAKIAYSVGVYSAVTQRNGLYLLKFGPFKDRDSALKVFKTLDSNGLISQECSLEQGH